MSEKYFIKADEEIFSMDKIQEKMQQQEIYRHLDPSFISNALTALREVLEAYFKSYPGVTCPSKCGTSVPQWLKWTRVHLSLPPFKNVNDRMESIKLNCTGSATQWQSACLPYWRTYIQSSAPNFMPASTPNKSSNPWHKNSYKSKCDGTPPGDRECRLFSNNPFSLLPWPSLLCLFICLFVF